MKEKPFDYGDIPKRTADALREQAQEIRSRVRSAFAEVFAIGKRLQAARDVLGSRFWEWVDCAVGMPPSTARDWLNATRVFAHRLDIPFDHLPLNSMFELARPSVPESASVEAIRRAQAGEHIDRATAKSIAAAHRVTEPEPSDITPEPVPPVPGFYFATFRDDGSRGVIEVRRDGIPHLRGFRPGVVKSFDLTAFRDYSERLVDPRGKR